MRIGTFFIILFFLSSLAASSINIAVAANVSYAIKPLIQEFNKSHPHVQVRVTLGSSGKLVAQILHGAPYDIFMSADMKYPQTLYEKKLTSTQPRVYAEGALVLLSSREQDFTKGLELLKTPQIKRIAVANPKTAPYGVASRELLQTHKLYETLKPKFIFGESISQTISYATVATDIGFIAKSSLFSPAMQKYKKGKNWINLSSDDYSPIKQGVVLLKPTTKSKAAKAFYDFLFTQKAKKILSDFGYKTS